MTINPSSPEISLFYGTVVAAFPESRLVDIKWINADVTKRSVIVVQDSNDFSFPRVGETGLIIGSDILRYFYLGRISFGYQFKLSGDDLNPTTQKKWPVKIIEAGEAQLLNMLTGVSLFLSNSGAFSLTNQLQDGIKYVRDKIGEPIRWLSVAAKAITLSSNTTNVSIGAVLRDIPAKGKKIILDLTRTKAAQEFMAQVTNIVGVVPLNRAKLQLGDIFIEPVVDPRAGIPQPHTEAGSVGAAAALRVLLAAFNDLGVESASIKMDNLGNMSISAPLPTGTLAINAGIKISIGGMPDITIEPAVLGTQLSTWLASHMHSSSVGPTGPPLPADVARLPTILSAKVFMA